MEQDQPALTAEEVLARYEATATPILKNTLTRKGELDLATAVVTSITDEISKNPGNPRAVWLEVGAALMSMSVHNVALSVQVAQTLAAAEAMRLYGVGALKREAFMIGGWVLFGCAVAAYMLGWV